MAEISIIMAVCGEEDYLAESIESILNQSFGDFELIVLNYGPANNIRTTIFSHDDGRIHLIDSQDDYIGSLNAGLKVSRGKYVVRLSPGDLMHVDQLKLNRSTMEEFNEITISSNRITIYGEKMSRRISEENISGLIELPLLRMILEETIFNVGSMIRRSFLTENNLSYKSYAYAEDFKLSAEIAGLKGVLYIESQPLLYRRISDTKISRKQRQQKLQAISEIRKEILYSLFTKNKNYPALVSLCDSYFELAKEELIPLNDVFRIVHALIMNNIQKINF